MSGLTPKQLEAVSGIAKGLTSSQIAKVLGISDRTVQRWQKLPEFVATLSQIQGEASRQVKAELVENVSSVNSRLENLASKSLDALELILDNPESRNGDRIQAAKILLSEWQRSKPPVPDEFSALALLIQAGWFPDCHIARLSQAFDEFKQESRAIFQVLATDERDGYDL